MPDYLAILEGTASVIDHLAQERSRPTSTFDSETFPALSWSSPSADAPRRYENSARWLVGLAAEGTALALGGEVPAFIVGGLVRGVLTVEPEEVGLLREANRKLDLLLQGPYRTGRRALQDALVSTDEAVQSSAPSCSRALYGCCWSSWRLGTGGALRTFHVALCWIALGEYHAAMAPIDRSWDNVSAELISRNMTTLLLKGCTRIIPSGDTKTIVMIREQNGIQHKKNYVLRLLRSNYLLELRNVRSK